MNRKLVAALEKITAALSKQSLLSKFDRIFKDPDFTDSVLEHASEVGHGDSEFFDQEELENLDIDVSSNYKKFKKTFNPKFEQGKLVVWRSVNTEEIKEPLGVYWTWDKKFAKSYWSGWNPCF